MKSCIFVVLLFLFWILLSGHLEPLLLGLGLALSRSRFSCHTE